MNTQRSLAGNTVYSGVASAGNVLLVALVIIAARVLGDEAFGIFSFALALASIFEIAIDLGLNTLTARNVARDKSLSASYLPNILGWKCILAVVAMLLLVLTVNLLGKTGDARAAAYIMGAAIVLRSFKSTSHSFFQAYERFDLIVLTVYVERIALLVFGIIALLYTRSLIVFALVFALVRIPDLAFSYWLLHRKIAPIRISLQPETVKRLQSAALPFGLYMMVLTAYWHIGIVMLSGMRPPQEVGWYSAGHKIYEGLSVFPALLCAVLLPRLSRLFAEDPGKHAALSFRSLRYLAVGSVPLVIVIGILAPWIVRLLYGDEYMPAVIPVRILLAAAVLMFSNMALNTVLVSANRERTVLKVVASGFLVIGASNLILISEFGILGAAYAVVIGEVWMFTLLISSVRRGLFRLPVHTIAWKPVTACVLGVGLLYITRVTEPVPSAALFAAFYTAILFALRTFDASEWSIVKDLFSFRSTLR